MEKVKVAASWVLSKAKEAGLWVWAKVKAFVKWLDTKLNRCNMSLRTRVAVLVLSAAGVTTIANWEGFRDKAYLPTKNDRPTSALVVLIIVTELL